MIAFDEHEYIDWVFQKLWGIGWNTLIDITVECFPNINGDCSFLISGDQICDEISIIAYPMIHHDMECIIQVTYIW